jgi:hypothetical protein
MNGLVDIAGCQGLSIQAVQRDSMEAGLAREHFFKALLSSTTAVNNIFRTHWTSLCTF